METLKSAKERFKATGEVDPTLGIVVDGCVRWRPRGMSDIRWKMERRRLSNLRYYNGLSEAKLYSRTKIGQ